MHFKCYYSVTSLTSLSRVRAICFSYDLICVSIDLNNDHSSFASNAGLSKSYLPGVQPSYTSTATPKWMARTITVPNRRFKWSYGAHPLKTRRLVVLPYGMDVVGFSTVKANTCNF